VRLAILLSSLLTLLPLPCGAEQPHAQEIQRAVMQLDQRSAEFARGAAPQPLPSTAGLPLHSDPVIARELRPYERLKAVEGYELRLPPPVVLDKPERPLPLPGGPRHGVEPIAATGVGG
jgi:hypothetical protein